MRCLINYDRFHIDKALGFRKSEEPQQQQEIRAHAGVSARQSRHLAINFDFVSSAAIERLTCSATSLKRRTPTIARFPNPPSFDAPARGIPSEFLDETYIANRRGMGATVW